eukprot:TRINITY_DN64166_c0_g1_i1.p1 TRINITY_DN64166_c0_g1~~TRINITY_DN64166_c0_g1_i1.p1  ORF type:complete len:156 (-),score=18.52 TRINITY_DN64166_c0_g1_i1:130-597(-)
MLGFFFQAEDGIRDAQESRGLGDVYKRQAVHRGLQLSEKCGVPPPFLRPPPIPARGPAHSEHSVFVSTSGDDASSGTEQSPVRTLPVALELCTLLRARTGSLTSCSVLLRGGTYRLAETVVLGGNIATPLWPRSTLSTSRSSSPALSPSLSLIHI